MHTIGITSIGSGVAQAVLDSLKSSGKRYQLVGFDASPWAKGAYECEAVHLVPFADCPDYKESVVLRSGVCRSAENRER